MTSPHQLKRKERRPCDACRKRKSRCVLEADSTVCVLCKFHSQECTFLHEPQMRKRKVAQDTDELGPSGRMNSSSSPASKKSPVTQARVIRTTNGTGVEEYDDLDGPSLLKKTLGLQNKHHSQYVGSTRGLEPALLGTLSSASTTEVLLASGSLRRVNSTEAFLLIPDPGTQGYSEELDDLDAIEAIIQPHGRPLVNIYFRVVFPSFPILHKEVFLEKYSRSYREFSPPLLAAVYLLALQYWTYHDELSDCQKPDTVELERLARKALGDTLHRPKLSTVQAGLLLLQHADTDSAELTAQLVSISYGLGLHLDATSWSIPDWEKGLRKRLGWGLYLQDKWSSLGSGRPSLINSWNWALRSVTDDDFPENASHEDDQEGSSEVEKGRILFAHMIQLTQILADLLETVFTVRTTREIADAGDNGLAMLLEKTKPTQLRLENWFSNLPECLSMDVTHVMKLSSVGYLRLAYVATEITLHRRIILALSCSTDPQLYQYCRAVAHKQFAFAIDFVQALKPQHLSSFWYFASPQNFALIGVFGTLLLSTTSTSEEADFYKTKLREYRWMLKINSENGARYMRPAMALLDINMKLLDIASNSNLSQPPENVARGYIGRNQPHLPQQRFIQDCFTYSTPQVSANGNLSPPVHYSFHPSYYTGSDSASISPIAHAPTMTMEGNLDGFGYGMGEGGHPGLWTY